MSVFVLDKRGSPLMPCTEKRARLLLDRGRARVHRLVPFTIRLMDRYQEDSVLQTMEVKLDPGSKTTGIAVVIADGKAVNVKMLMELSHRGMMIKRAMVKRSACRRNRRNRKTRYRQVRLLNRARPKGWLPPSLQHRVLTTMSWVRRLMRWAPIECLAYERVNFDLQRMMDQNISGKQYHQGELYKKEIMEYLLEKYNRTCVYCDATGDVRLEIEHTTPRALGGSDSVRNLVLACRDCNRKKGALPLAVFLANQPERLAKIQKQLKTPLRDAAAVNATKNGLFTALLKTGLPVTESTGVQTKLNRAKLDVPKTHALDAACVGEVDSIRIDSAFTLEIKSTGRGLHQRVTTDKYGFPKSHRPRKKRFFGFATGDIVIFSTNNNRVDKHSVRIVVRSCGIFSARLRDGRYLNIRHDLLKLNQRCDGYTFKYRNDLLEKDIHLGRFIRTSV